MYWVNSRNKDEATLFWRVDDPFEKWILCGFWGVEVLVFIKCSDSCLWLCANHLNVHMQVIWRQLALSVATMCTWFMTRSQTYILPFDIKNKITHSNEVLWCFNICTHVEYLNYSKPLTLHILPMKKMFNILPSSAMRYKVHGCPVDKKNLRKLRTIYTAKEINQTSEKEAHNRKDSLSANLSENYYSEYIKNWKNQKQKYQQ